VSIRRFFAVFVALSVLFAPGMAASAMAAPSHHGMAAMNAGHCDAPGSEQGDHGKMASKACCVSMCMALAVAPAGPAEISKPRRQVTQFAIPPIYHGTQGEIATPPPKLS
jgi:hypothetical protein